MQDHRERGRTVPAAQSSKLNIFGNPLFVLSDGSAIPMVIGEQIVPPGHAIPNHIHADDDELFHVIEGELTISGPQVDRHAFAGACIALPRGYPVPAQRHEWLPSAGPGDAVTRRSRVGNVAAFRQRRPGRPTDAPGNWLV